MEGAVCTVIGKGIYFFAFLIKEENLNLCHSSSVLPFNRSVVLWASILNIEQETWKLGELVTATFSFFFFLMCKIILNWH